MTTLPDCPACDCRDSLSIVREGREENAGRAVCECSGCNAVLIVDLRRGIVVRQVKHAS